MDKLLCRLFSGLDELCQLLSRHTDKRHVIAVKLGKMVNATLEIWHETVCEIVDEELGPLHIEYSSHTLAISHPPHEVAGLVCAIAVTDM